MTTVMDYTNNMIITSYLQIISSRSDIDLASYHSTDDAIRRRCSTGEITFSLICKAILIYLSIVCYIVFMV